MDLDFSVFFTGYNNIIAIHNISELMELAECLTKQGHKPISVDLFSIDVERGYIGFRLFKNSTDGRLTWCWDKLSHYCFGKHNVFTLNDLRQQVADLGEISFDEVSLESLFFA